LNCLDEDTVLTFVDGRTPEDARDAIAAHLAGCASCAELVAASAGNETVWAPQPLPHAISEAAGLAGGHTIGRYVILNLIGRGGMGEVYAAYDPQLDRRIALKLLHDGVLRETSARAASKRLLREAKAIARLSHPNVVVVHDAGAIGDPVHGERVFLAMEFIEGETLSAWLDAAPRSWRAVRDVFVAAGEGLAAAHEAGLVHRDFKPQNVMVSRDGSVRVMDFGLASDMSGPDGDGAAPDLRHVAVAPTPETVALTRTGVLLGTPIYMAPEQFRGQAADARSDQFSFCVALFEAVHGERPFPSDTLPQLMEAVLAGRVREPPARPRIPRIPSFLRRLLLRGLSPDPAARFPSMRALLDQLRADPARRRRGVAAGAVVALAFLAGGAGVHRVATRGQRMCGGAAAKLEGIWEVGDGARRAAVQRAFLGTGRDFAEQTWTRVSAMLDEYGRRWTDMYTDSCQATHVRGDQSAEVLDLRTSCLEGPRGALGALTELFTRADGAVLAEAVNAVQALPPIEHCSDVPALRGVVPPPGGAARARVAALTTRLAEVKALRDTGQWRAALTQARALADEGRTVGYQPLLAEALSLRSWLEHESGDSTHAGPTMEQALWMGVAGHRDDIAAEMGAQLVAINGYYLGSVEAARHWIQPAEALLARLGPGHERITSWLYQARAALAERSGDYPTAKREYDNALAFKMKALPANHPDIAKTYYSRANVELAQGDATAAHADAEKALAIYRAAYGPDSPLVWAPLDIRGEALNLLHRYKEAESDFRDAARRSGGLYGDDHAWTAYALNDLGQVLVNEQRPREAIPILEKALRTRERLERSPDDTAETRFALARALWGGGEDRPRALTLASAAQQGYRTMAGHERQVAAIEAWLAGKAGAQ
jgi:tetratricopeptide (TPR) repeat protein